MPYLQRPQPAVPTSISVTSRRRPYTHYPHCTHYTSIYYTHHTHYTYYPHYTYPTHYTCLGIAAWGGMRLTLQGGYGLQPLPHTVPLLHQRQVYRPPR